MHVADSDRPVLDWPTRLKIAIGAAKGFAYLHEDCEFIHTHMNSEFLSGFFFPLKFAFFFFSRDLLGNSLGSVRIIHRDIKASNILVDMNFEAKVICLSS